MTQVVSVLANVVFRSSAYALSLEAHVVFRYLFIRLAAAADGRRDGPPVASWSMVMDIFNINININNFQVVVESLGADRRME